MRLAFFLLCVAAHPAITEPLYNTPVYDPASRSYFALIDVHERHESKYHYGYVWPEALRDATRNVYKGVHGRLAMVTSIETHEFLLRTFRPDTHAWIGYRYICKTKTLIDSLGQKIPATAFRAWDKDWRQDSYICNINKFTHDYDDDDFMPVAYSPIDKGFAWIGKGRNKGFDAYFIEYPTGKP